MKILTIHSDFIEFEPKKKAMKAAEESKKEKERIEECLVVFSSVEKSDEGSEESIAKSTSKQIESVSEQVKCKNIVLYPFVHLTQNPSNPETAKSIINLIESELKEKKFKVQHSPFGWYKSFNIKCKGHPLSELSREITTDNITAKAAKGNIAAEAAKGNVPEGSKDNDPDLTKEERDQILKKMGKIKMQATRGNNDLKSNVELGRDLDLYILNEIVGSGLPLLTPKGTTIKREIERFIVDEELKRGYEHTSTPVMAKSDLYKISGHWQHYKDDMFVLDVHGEDFALRPMTCPFQFVLYKRKPRSHKDLPKKYAEISTLFRNEKSGELRGLTRVRQFTLADAHIICTPDQLEEEFKKVLDLVKFVMTTLGIEVWYRFSKWDPENKDNKYIDDPKAWDMTQKLMKDILDHTKLKYVTEEDEAAFYGPKLDLQYKDVYGKEDTLLTIQMDFSLPQQFDLKYLDKDGKEKNPMVIHRSSTGATERLISYLLEKTQGNLPLWLSPIQARVMNMNDDNTDYAEEVRKKLFDAGIRVELDDSNESIGKKARNAIVDKVFYLVTVGEKEQKQGKVAVRSRDSKDITSIKLEKFIKQVKDEISNRSRT